MKKEKDRMGTKRINVRRSPREVKIIKKKIIVNDEEGKNEEERERERSEKQTESRKHRRHEGSQ